MLTTHDIKQKIELDFGDKASEIEYIFEQAIAKAQHLNDSRIIRCILFLAEGDSEKLKQNLTAATIDPRDVMYWAEYSGQGPHEDRLHDFSRPFGEADQL